VVAALEGLAAHVVRDAPPFVERPEAALDDAMPSPQREERCGEALAGFAVGAIVLEVDARGGAVILAARVDRPRREAALVFGPRPRREDKPGGAYRQRL